MRRKRKEKRICCEKCVAKSVCKYYDFYVNAPIYDVKCREYLPGLISVEDHLPTDECFKGEYDWVLVYPVYKEDGRFSIPLVAEYRKGVWMSRSTDEDIEFVYGMKVEYWKPIYDPRFPRREENKHEKEL